MLHQNKDLFEDLPRFRFVFIWEAKSKKEMMPIDFQIGGYDDNIRRRDFIKKKNSDAKDSLSIVIPILIYHGKAKWEKKRLYDYFEPYLPDILLDSIPKEKYIVIDIQAMQDEEIESAIDLGELRSAFIALKHGHEKKYFEHNMKKVLKFVHNIPTKELLETYLQMLLEYMQRRTEMENEAFNAIVEQSNDKEMTTTFKTIFETAREKAEAKGVRALIRTTLLSDEEIAKELEVLVSFVKSIRKEIENSKIQ